MENIKMKEALNAAKLRCSKGEKCISEVVDFLARFDITEKETAMITAILIAEKFIDESRYARAYVLDKFRFNKWGRIKIRFELQRKNIPAAIIIDSLDSINEKEYSDVIKFLISQKKIKTDNAYEYRQKMLRYLYGKGYEPEIVEKFINCP
ncbi:MAG: RecX family transcriptional regulator [Bacteroidales bacterium]|nr:RecX family transcriptional regulator [Bacteroidales bacterium]HOY38409.1 regulatory protein RecX [Bacteroidales bacterium]HQP05120.1 regulatory protein RecX [Bacteroidales bacterium]